MRFKGLIVLLMIFMWPLEVKAEDLSVVDKGWLKQIAMAEAEGESVEGKAAVMKVVLNRVDDERFPDTITEVLFEKNQFSCINTGGRIWTVRPDEDCQKAIELIDDGWDKTKGALYFNSCNTTAGQYLFTIGNHKFYK